MEIPSEVVIKSLLKEGIVFYFPELSFSSSEFHYFIVINRNPSEDRNLLLVSVTSQIGKRKIARRNMPPSTLVEVSPEDLSFLRKNSIIDCNSPIVKTVGELVMKFQKNELKLVNKDVASSKLVDTLRQGVKDSPLVSIDIKKLIT